MPKRPDPFYMSTYWRGIREIILERDGHTCTVPGCFEPAAIVDHIKSRKSGGDESLPNLRSLCRVHDTQMQERSSGFRKRGGKLPSVCNRDGLPTDPTHPWFRR